MSGHMQSPITDHRTQRVAMRKSTRWGAILVGMVALVAAFAGTALAGVVRPPETGPRPTTLALPPTYVGPTADITAVANAISSSHKSLEIVVTVKPGLAPTGPVTISIRFINSAGLPKVVTQCYVPSTGNRFVFHDVEWQGQPRRVGMTATLSQDKLRLGDKGYSFSIPWSLDLDPLYDVTISRMGFFLRADCDLVGDSEIHFEWFSPDDVRHAYSFHTSKGKNTFINQFAWARTDVSASAGLHYPNYWFYEHDPVPTAACAYLGPVHSNQPLVPGVTRNHIEVLKEYHCQSCSAPIEYKITYHVSKYAVDSPGGGTGCFPSAIQLPADVPPGGVRPPVKLPVTPAKPPGGTLQRQP
jgi:hypothetical protein